MSNYLLADLLSSIKNYRTKDVGKSFDFPFSGFCSLVLSAMKSTGYIKDFSIYEQSPGKKYFSVFPKYDERGFNVFSEYKLMSKPSIKSHWTLRTLSKECTSHPTRTFILSTSKGVLSSQEALVKKTGGMLLFVIY